MNDYVNHSVSTHTLTACVRDKYVVLVVIVMALGPTCILLCYFYFCRIM